MWRLLLGIGTLFMAAAPSFAQEVELDQCLREGGFCSETTDALVDSSCGQVFYAYRGRLSWAPLRNAGPVTIAVETHRRVLITAFPVYVGIATVGDTLECQTRPAGSIVLMAHGSHQCGGTWESVGPIDLTRLGIPLGGLYRLQLQFFWTPPNIHFPFHTSVGVSCIRLTLDRSTVVATTWGDVKALYK